MQAVVCDRYGPPDVLVLRDLPRPVPGPGEIRVQIRASTVNRSDAGYRAGTPPVARLITGLNRPRRRVLGSEFAGEVEAAGPAVTRFRAGDRVFGVNAWRFGAHAEFLCLAETAPVALMSDGAAFTDAAAVCDGAILALMGLRPARVGKGRSILVYGASGSIGTAAVQLSRHFGADVTAVCGPNQLDLVRSLGAGQVFDYTRDDFTAAGQSWDVIFDAVGKHSFRRCRAALRPGGIYLATDHLSNLPRAWWTRFADKKVLFPIPPRYTQQDVEFLKDLIEAGRYRPVIDRSYPLADVIEATRYVETEQKTGNVVLTVP